MNKSLDQAHQESQNLYIEQPTSQSQGLRQEQSPSTQKMFRSNSKRSRSSQHAKSSSKNKAAEEDGKYINPDRRKLNAKELKLELSRGYDEVDCDMKRSGSFRRGTSKVSRESSFRHKRSQSSKGDEKPIVEAEIEAKKEPSTPVRASVAHSISSYLGSFGLPTPPSSSRRQREEKEKQMAHELKKQNIRHLTPPQTPSNPHLPHLIPIIKPGEETPTEPEWIAQNQNFDNRNMTSFHSASRLSSHDEEEEESISELTKTPCNMRSKSEAPERKPTNTSGDGLFENPRPITQLPAVPGESTNGIEESTIDYPLYHLVNSVNRDAQNPTDIGCDLQTALLPIMMIANAIGFPHQAILKADKRNSHKLATENEMPSTTSKKPDVDYANKSHRTSLFVKTAIHALPRRPFSRASSESKVTKNSPYLQGSLTPTGGYSNISSTNEDIGQVSFSEDSSIENLQTLTTPTSAGGPISAFDDDSSDDDYFGDLLQLPGLGARNLRRKRTSSRRFSRDSANLTLDRPYSRLSFSSRQEKSDSPRESEFKHTSSDNFLPIHQIPIPEEAQLSTSAGTFNKPLFGAGRRIRENEVVHLKDGDGFDHLVLEHEEAKNLVVSGTFDCLLMELCTAFETGDDDTFADVFLRSSVFFTTPLDLIKSLTGVFRTGNSRVQERILLLFDRWLRILPEEIFSDDDAKERFLMFLGEVSCWGHQQLTARLTRTYTLMKEKLQGYRMVLDDTKKFFMISGTPDVTSFPENLKLFFMDDSVVMEIARYLTAVDLVLFKDASHTAAITSWWMSQFPSEQESWSWETDIPYPSERDQSDASEKINRLIRRSLSFKFWIQHEILAMRKVQDRADLITSMIQLALILREQGNFQSCLTITEALAGEVIVSLEKTWDEVPIEKIREFSELRALLDQKTYLLIFAKQKDFAIPHFPFFIKAIATLLGQSTNSSFRYSDASKTHMDAQIDSTLYRPSTATSGERASKTPPALLDFKKYRAFVKEASMFRAMAKFPPAFVSGIDRKCFAFRNMQIGRLALPRDAASGSGSNRGRSRSGSTSSLTEETGEISSIHQIAEIIEGRIDTVLSPILVDRDELEFDKKKELVRALASLHRCVKGETMPSWPTPDAGNINFL